MFQRAFRLIVLAVIIFSLCCLPLAAQTDDELFGGSSTASDDDLFGGSSTTSDDDLFGGDDDMFGDSMIEEITPTDTTSTDGAASVSSSALGVIFEAGSVRFGGSLSATTDVMASWNDPYNGDNHTSKYFSDGFYNSYLSPSITSSLFFDARPKETLRLYGKININYPFSVAAMQSITIPSISVFELFTDFSWNDTVFFRFGKHTVNWGVGYFFSPADIINLGVIDPSDPTKQREGPISLRSQIIFPGTQNCLWLYVLPSTNLYGSDYTRYTALAGKYEFLLGDYEVGIGAWYKYQRAPRVSLTLTGAIKKMALFAEFVGAYGTESQWQKGANGGDIPYSEMWPICQATVGGSYSWKVPQISLSWQYFYNGFGSLNPADLSATEYLALKNWYSYSGQHYVALSLSKSELFTRRLSASAFTLMSLKDFSGMAKGTLSFSFFDECSMSFGPTFTFGCDGGEYLRNSNGENGKENIACTLSFTLGGGKF